MPVSILRIQEALDKARPLLPNQAPLARFVQQNTLAAFESLDFETAQASASARLGSEPYWSEANFEQAVQSGRIQRKDLDAALEELGASVEPLGAELPSVRQLRIERLLHPTPPVEGEAVLWWLSETDILSTEEARSRWTSALLLARQVVGAEEWTSVRARDLLFHATGLDIDGPVHGFLVRFLAVYLDQGIAYWALPFREEGMWRSFLRLQEKGVAGYPWLDGLHEEAKALLRSGRSSEEQVVQELEARTLTESELDAFVERTLLALPGWTGMVHQLEVRPDRAPALQLPVKLIDLLAIRLLLTRYAVRFFAALELGTTRSFEEHFASLRKLTPPQRDPHRLALEIFLASTRHELSIEQLDRETIFAEAVRDFSSLERRRAYFLAFERNLRVRALDALVSRARNRTAEPAAPVAASIFCIDEREESYRRHLEAAHHGIVTYGAAGNFELFHDYLAYGTARPVPLCPQSVIPKHLTREVPAGAKAPGSFSWIGAVADAHEVGSRTLGRGALASLLGPVQAVPLVLRTLFPRAASGVVNSAAKVVRGDAPTRLALDYDPTHSTETKQAGFKAEEQAEIVERLLRSIGLIDEFPKLVVVMGHGSSSSNNPHIAAYNCGACAGGRGGPNARAIAVMANSQSVRELLRTKQLDIPDTTLFVGGYHDTATDDTAFYDEGTVPSSFSKALDEVRTALMTASGNNALERSRRFADAPANLTATTARKHVAARTVDLAQPRAEYGGATTALAVFGRRSLTRGLFLDRRSFLISYDPTQDDEAASTLEALLALAGPVGSGICLQYYYSTIDPVRYGAGSKLPHNVTGLLGVMNGAGSDLRTGLYWQGVEIHEPVRLFVVIESTRERLSKIVERHPVIARLALNRWILVAVIEPDTNRAFFLEKDGFVEHDVQTDPTQTSDWLELFRNRSGNLPFAMLKEGSVQS